MSNKKYFIYGKLFFKPNKFVLLFIFLLAMFFVIFFANNNSLFNIIEGNTPCKYNSANVEKDAEKTGKKHEKEHKQNKTLPKYKDNLNKAGSIPVTV
jgi:glucan phosphoethanolaminetransferase (alkaline phosphatase superfamily)